MTCPSCGKPGGWHSLMCEEFASATLGLGTVPVPALGVCQRVEPDEMDDCAAEGITIAQLEARGDKEMTA